ncbi:hypothetical protein CDAR_290711 [Caerostris darwini]|uniref:Uncharacterized protein n=1 Tax=Caerostris darwini TaxID=1538125 RepID=A0AAV4SXE5_9ARAC|nr:hypothetical protein CDAR_290711 [Caerostris darwini]
MQLIQFHTKRSMKGTLLTIQDFLVLVPYVEAAQHSRPLDPPSDDPNAMFALSTTEFRVASFYLLVLPLFFRNMTFMETSLHNPYCGI